MSRIGKKSIATPKGVKVAVSGQRVTVEGPKGTLSLEARPEVAVQVAEDGASVTVSMDESLAGVKTNRAYWGLTRSLIQNMVVGVTQGYSKTMEVVGVGYNAQVQGNQIRLQVGYANPIVRQIPQGLDVAVERNMIRISGADKQVVGQFAAELRAVRKPEPYNSKGIKYANEVIKRKQGKAFGS
ncbi:MAG: 50S ribosomal protein L6 [Phycisphaerales bacterium JB039]